MSDGHRIKRVEREVQEIVAEYLQRSMRFQTLVSITRVEASKDLQHAKIYVSVFGEDLQSADTMGTIEERQSEIQRYLGHNLNTRYTPKLKFFLDQGFDHMEHVGEVLKEVAPSQSDEGDYQNE